MNINKYFEKLNKIEFVVTNACTGKCKHCSQGNHRLSGISIDKEIASEIVSSVCDRYDIDTVMTFGGEPLLFPETVYAIHRVAKILDVSKRQLITNGYFSKDIEYIKKVAESIVDCGVNEVLLSVDAFHQETIPIQYPLYFAECLLKSGGIVKTQPAWLVAMDNTNKYNIKTTAILEEFNKIGVCSNAGNIIFPSGNALIYLSEYFDCYNTPTDPYVDDPFDIRTLSVDHNGNVLGGNIYSDDILNIISNYKPEI